MENKNIFTENLSSRNEEIKLDTLEQKGIELWIKREDTLHEFISGNKYRKLKYNIKKAQQLNKNKILTFGGAYSNHIVATAVAGKLAGIETIGIIRGDELALKLDKVLKENKTLKIAHENGMTLKFISRTAYKLKDCPIFNEGLQREFGDYYRIPEGGTNKLAIEGCQEILTKNDEKFDYICCAVGTGGTIAGIVNSSYKNQNILGFPALKGSFSAKDISNLTTATNWDLVHDYNFGGYGKFNEDLIYFINDFLKKTKITLDPIYTGKMLFGILDLIRKNKFKSGTKILAIHTGGLQGIDGVNKILRKKKLSEIITL